MEGTDNIQETVRPKVSIIIPVYNTEAYLEEAVNSIRRQTLKELEIIAVDDGSTDGSGGLLRCMQSEEPRLKVYTQSNSGQSVARNNGLVHATGEFVYFFDSDDVLAPPALECCYEAAVRRQSDVVCFDGLFMTDLDNFIDTPPTYRRAGVLPPSTCPGSKLLAHLMHIRRFTVSPCLNLIRTDYLRLVGLQFYSGIIHEDQLFTFLLYLRARRVTFVPEAFFFRRMRRGSTMTSAFSMRNVEGYLTVCRELKQYSADCRELTSEQRGLIKKQVRELLGVTASSSLALGFRERMHVFRKLCRFGRQFSPKSALLLFFPFLKRKTKAL